MNTQRQTASFFRFVAAATFGALVITTAQAAPMKIEATISPKSDSRFDFADGSKRYLLAAQREGKTAGTGPLAGATMLEWGFHDVNPAAGANVNGYLIFTAAEGDVAYLKYQFRAVPVTGSDGKTRFLANGFWETAGGTGKLKGLRGAGTLSVNPAERRWTIEGDLVAND